MNMEGKTVYIGAFIVVTDATVVSDDVGGFATVTGNLLPDEEVEGTEPVEVEFYLHQSQLVIQTK